MVQEIASGDQFLPSPIPELAHFAAYGMKDHCVEVKHHQCIKFAVMLRHILLRFDSPRPKLHHPAVSWHYQGSQKKQAVTMLHFTNTCIFDYRTSNEFESSVKTRCRPAHQALNPTTKRRKHVEYRNSHHSDVAEAILNFLAAVQIFGCSRYRWIFVIKVSKVPKPRSCKEVIPKAIK